MNVYMQERDETLISDEIRPKLLDTPNAEYTTSLC
jgi:hypothetical protein